MTKNDLRKLINDNVYPTFEKIVDELMNKHDAKRSPFPYFDGIYFYDNRVSAKVSYVYIPNKNYNKLSKLTQNLLKEIEEMLNNKDPVFCKRDPIDKNRTTPDNLYNIPLLQEDQIHSRLINYKDLCMIQVYIAITPINGENKFYLNGISVAVPSDLDTMSVRTDDLV